MKIIWNYNYQFLTSDDVDLRNFDGTGSVRPWSGFGSWWAERNRIGTAMRGAGRLVPDASMLFSPPAKNDGEETAMTVEERGRR